MKSKKEILYSPYKKGYLKVTDGHELYYELYGNPEGKPIIFLHGGPGGGFSESDKRFFDPKIWNVLMFDQRGAGRSRPFASLKNNTTWHLVKDINSLLDKAGFKKVTLFGGSWGSTLALVYSISHPERVNGIVLRGIWLGTDNENDYIFRDMHWLRPQAWERLMSFVPENRRKDLSKFYLEKMLSKDKKTSEKYAYEWAYYEMSLLKLQSSPKKIEEELADGTYKSLSPLETHYFVNTCFLEPNYILKNSDKIAHLPISIIHGEYDLICPPLSAYQLHKKLKKAKLHFVHGGHSSSDKAVERQLIKEVKKIAKLV